MVFVVKCYLFLVLIFWIIGLVIFYVKWGDVNEVLFNVIKVLNKVILSLIFLRIIVKFYNFFNYKV